jgi:hypothetical protein
MCSSGTTNCLWCSASLYISVNFGEVVVRILLADSLLSQMEPWLLSVRHVRTPAGTSNARRKYSSNEHRKYHPLTASRLGFLTIHLSCSMFETLYLSMDANFKLKQKERGFSDPPLANGFAYMVSNEILHRHLASCKDSSVLTQEVNLFLLM